MKNCLEWGGGEGEECVCVLEIGLQSHFYNRRAKRQWLGRLELRGGEK